MKLTAYLDRVIDIALDEGMMPEMRAGIDGFASKADGRTYGADAILEHGSMAVLLKLPDARPKPSSFDGRVSDIWHPTFRRDDGVFITLRSGFDGSIRVVAGPALMRACLGSSDSMAQAWAEMQVVQRVLGQVRDQGNRLETVPNDHFERWFNGLQFTRVIQGDREVIQRKQED